MASFLDKIKIKNATDSKVKLDLGCDHISTANWMQFNVAYNKELVPKEKIDVNMETFTRLLPLTRPTFGRANVNNRAFFVPYRTIFDGWNDFITDAVHVVGGHYDASVSSIGNVVPNFANDVLISYLTDSAIATYVDNTDPDSPPYDFTYGQNSYKLTGKGRQVMKILNSLGYVPQFIVGDTTMYNALPLLAVAKIYIDWYYPSQYVGVTGAWNAVQNILSNHTATGLYLNKGDLTAIFNLISWVCYDSDYFTAAWDNPNAPSSGLYSGMSIPEVSRVKSASPGVSYNSVPTLGSDVSNAVLSTSEYASTSGARQWSEDGTPIIRDNMRTSDSTLVITPISQYILHALHALTDYMKRHQLVGARALDRYLARFGVQLDAEKTNRSLYLGNYKCPIQIGDIMSTADTAGSGLGNYAGKAVGYGKGNFDYSTDEYGQFVIISTIIPAAGYFQGIDRHVLHTSRTDFWTPEFDNLGVQGIAKSELFVNWFGSKAENSVNGNNADVFGFIPKYAEYKVGKDKITGDFRYDTINTGEDTWYLNRSMVPYTNDQSGLIHSLDFIKGVDYEQYNRIFQNANDISDPFKVIYHFEIASYSPMKALFDTYEFEDKGKEVTEDVNGVKMN